MKPFKLNTENRPGKKRFLDLFRMGKTAFFAHLVVGRYTRDKDGLPQTVHTVFPLSADDCEGLARALMYQAAEMRHDLREGE